MNYAAILAALQNFLRGHDTAQIPDLLMDLCGIKVKNVDGFWMLDYDQISVRWNHESQFPFVCRGLVLDEKFDLVAVPMFKFFNDFEGYADEIDWENAVVFDKCDGTMVSRWWDKKAEVFRYSTRYNSGSGLKSTNVNGLNDMNWDGLFTQAFAPVLSQINQPINETWVFEVESPFNRVVLIQDKIKVTLLAIRNIETLQERDIVGHPLACKTYPCKSKEEVQAFVQSKSGLELEGCVVRGPIGNGFPGRVKMKNPDYMVLHHLKDSLLATWKNVALLVRTGDYAEKLRQIQMPEVTQIADKMRDKYWEEVDRTEKIYQELSAITSQKDFAVAVKASGVAQTDALFKMRAGKVKTVKEYFRTMEDTPYLRLCENLGMRAMLKEVGANLFAEDEERAAEQSARDKTNAA